MTPRDVQKLGHWSFLAVLLSIGAPLRITAADSELEFFEKRIRPLLVENCYKCHSAESEKLKGGLLLDTKEGLARGGESGPVIVPGDPEASSLIKAVQWTNEKLQMPPKKKLSDAEIADLTHWVKIGAPDPRSNTAPAPILAKASEHWAFQPPKRPSPPRVKDSSWPQNEVDFFVLAKLEENNLAPSTRADRRTLLRRASYDLTGLPPTFEEMQAFEKDPSPDAFKRAVDRLLDSPRYGEKWGRHWLDLARFADTKGYVYSDREEGQFVHSHVYRDWVIRAFNTDMPYDEFLRQQIAGDSLPGAKDAEGLESPLAATGFLTVGRRFLGVTHDIIDDRIDTLTKATQALTVSCARCHDHKFDPIPIQDYYSLYGVFSASIERTVRLEKTPPATKEYAEFKKGYDEREAKLQETFEKRKAELLAKIRTKTPEYLAAVLDADKLPTEEHYEIRGPDDLNPTIVRQWQSYLEQAAKSFHPVWAPWHAFAELPRSDFESRARNAWQKVSLSKGLNEAVRAAFEKKLPQSMVEAAAAYGELLASVNKKDLDKTELSASEKQLHQVLSGPESPVNVPPGSVWDVEWFFHEGPRVEFGKLQSEIDRWIIKAAGAPRYAVMLEDKPGAKNPRVFRRGNPANRGEEIPRQYLEVVLGKDRKPFQKGAGRLEMAEAIATKDNPLTARVFVNRVWAGHFGQGLVRTVNDFGTRSEPPSHPELLDWLANYFVDNGWSMKKLHRLILLSSTYQQKSNDNSNAAAKDPQNRLLARVNPHRLEFEELRDSLLMASGELTTEAGGKPRPLFAGKFVPKRSIYGFVDRQFLPGVYRVFDFPNPDLPSGQRSLTTVPQQALYLMNNAFLVDRAKALAARSETNGSQAPDERARFLYRAAFQREPSTDELQASVGFVRQAAAIPLPEPPPPPPPSAWSYGYGKIESDKVQQFTPLPYFAEKSWQGSADYPDAKLGWVQLTAEGGHAGNDLQHAAIRRWTAPLSGKINITGALEHKRTDGDGIRGTLVSSRHGVLGQWTLHNTKTKAEFERISVEKGDTIDFVVDIRGGLNNDDFTWAPAVKWVVDASAKYDKTEWDAKKEFAGPPDIPPAPLKPWESLAQALLMANEFVFVE
jgi:hypothetical protein